MAPVGGAVPSFADDFAMPAKTEFGKIECRDSITEAVKRTIPISASDVLWAARMIDDEGGGNDPEHAAMIIWALVQRGFRAVIAPSFSRIFLENAYNNGIVAVVLPAASVRACARHATLDVDVVGGSVALPSGERFAFELDPLRKTFLLGGGYLEYLHAKIPDVRAWHAARG